MTPELSPGAIVSFIHPALAAAAAALLALPLLIHLINRRRHRKVSWAAMRFLLAASRRDARRIRFEQYLLLLLRTLALGCVAFAVARPFMPSSVLGAVGQQRVHRILLIDDSLSMQQKSDDGATRFDAARRAATSLLASFAEPDPVSVVLMSQPARVLSRASYDRRQLREMLAALHPTARGTAVADALAAAADLTQSGDASVLAQQVYVVADWAKPAWSDGDRGIDQSVDAAMQRLLGKAQCHLIRCGESTNDNLAVTDFTTRQRLLRRDAPIRLACTVANYGVRGTSASQIVVTQDERILRRVDVPPLRPGEAQTISFSIAAPSGSQLALEARLVTNSADSLPADDRRWLVLGVPNDVDVLIVEGHSGAGRADGDGGYLATALAPRAGMGNDNLLQTERIEAHGLAGEPLAAYRFVALCNVAQLSEESWTHIERFVSDGGGLLVTLGDAVDSDNYNRLGFRGGAGVLPAGLGTLTEAPHFDGPVHVATDARVGELMRDFVAVPDSSLFRADIQKFFSLSLGESSLAPIRLDNGDVGLATHRFGRGRVAMLATAVDMSWSNLPAKGDFVSLMQKLVVQLLPDASPGRNLQVGQQYIEPLSAADAQRQLWVIDPQGQRMAAQIERRDQALALVLKNPNQPGVYHVGALEDAAPIAANVAPSESQTAVLDESVVRRQWGLSYMNTASGESISDAADRSQRSEAATALIHLALIALALETWAAMRFGAGR